MTPRVGIVVLALGLAGLVGCGGGGDSADPMPPTTAAAAPPSTEAPTTTTTAPTTTTEASAEDLTEVAVSEDLVQLIPRFGDEALLSSDTRFDIRRCDGLGFETLPLAQAEATFSEPESELSVGVYQVEPGAASLFLDDYLDSLLVCSDGEFVEDYGLGDEAVAVPFDSDASNGTFTLVRADDVVWVVQKRTPGGPAELTDAELESLAQVTGG